MIEFWLKTDTNTAEQEGADRGESSDRITIKKRIQKLRNKEEQLQKRILFLLQNKQKKDKHLEDWIMIESCLNTNTKTAEQGGADKGEDYDS